MLRLAGPQDRARHWAVTVHHGGRTFVATRDMAAIFESHALELIHAGESGLVPLLHRDGVDMLLVGPTTGFAIVPIEVTEPSRPRPASRGSEQETGPLPRQAG